MNHEKTKKANLVALLSPLDGKSVKGLQEIVERLKARGGVEELAVADVIEKYLSLKGV